MENKKIKPINYKESIDLLVRNNPNLTGKEIMELAIYQDKCYKLWVQQQDSKKIATIEKLNQQKYYKIQYGDSNKLVVYINIFKSYLSDGEIMVEGYQHYISMDSRSGSISVITDKKFDYKKWYNFTDDAGEIVTPITEEMYNSFTNIIKSVYDI